MIPISILDKKGFNEIISLKSYINDPDSYTRLVFCKKSIIKLYEYNKDDEEVISRDIETLLSISKINLPKGRFVFPLRIIIYNDRVIGYEMPYITGKKLSEALKYADSNMAKSWFVQIYRDIQFVEGLESPFAFSDLHEDNIIVDTAGNLIHCDLDGWKIIGGRGKSARYMNMQKDLLSNYPNKYRQETNKKFYYTDINTDILSLLVIILNYIMGDGPCFASLSQRDVVEYLKYIEKQGIPRAFLKMIKVVYSNEPNYIDEKAIMDLPDDLAQFSYASFVEKNNKFKDGQAACKYIIDNYGKYGR